MGISFKEAFKNESKELTAFCKANNVEGMHTGGGIFTYCYPVGIDNVDWLIATKDVELPTQVDELVNCSLDVSYFLCMEYDESIKFFKSIDLPGYTFSHDQFCEFKDVSFRDIIKSIREVNNRFLTFVKKNK
jgi:hypothetical protein